MSLLALPAAAITLEGAAADLAGQGWRGTGLKWQIRSEGESSVKMASLHISQLPESLSEISLSCIALALDDRAQGCRDGGLSLRWGQRQIQGQWQGLWADTGVQFDAQITLDKTAITLSYHAGPDFGADSGPDSGPDSGTEPGPKLSITVENLPLPQAIALMSELSRQASADVVPDWLRSPDGFVTGSMQLSLGLLPALAGQWSISNLSFDSVDGTRAGAGLEVAGEVRAGFSSSGLDQLNIAVSLISGELLVDPAYFSFTEMPPLRFEADMKSRVDGGWTLTSLAVSDGDSLALVGGGEMGPQGQLNTLQLTLQSLTLEQAFPRYLAAMAEGAGLREVSSSGVIEAAVTVTNGQLSHVSAALQDVSFSSNGGQFGARALDGVVDYSAAGDSLDSDLQWSSLRYYTLVVGPASSRFFVGGGQLQLLDPLFLPVLDGGLQIDELAVDNLGAPDLAIDFRGDIRPMALDQITRALDWPVLSGTLSGAIPRVSLRNQVVEVGGAVVINVFDGRVVMDQLRLERLFGVLPTLAADVRIESVDLEQMTGAFSFGKIEGMLAGEVRGLRLLNWRPVAFDLDLQTVPDSGVRQRISQRAVDNLSSIGGGVAALGTTVLRIFDDFGYQSLGLKCLLKNNVCTMGGVGESGNGYFLVRGSGLPRIDIKGYSRQVDWPQLLRRLQAATESGPASIE